jgi:hypothetical protein
MKNQLIKCPKCGNDIEITEVIARDIEEKVKSEYESKLTDALKHEREIFKLKEKEFERARLSLENDFAEKIECEKKKMLNKIKAESETELNDLKLQLESNQRKLIEANKKEFEIRKMKNELEVKLNSVELDIQRRVDEEKNKLKNEVEDKFKLKEREKEELINRYKKQVEDLKRKLEQGSQQLQGEVQELELEDFLRSNFPLDIISPVGKGVQGADVMHEVINQYGQKCGKILWESKRTKNWNDGWIPKLKTDLRESKADAAIIVSQVLPSDINHIGEFDGIWVVSFQAVYGITLLLREKLIEMNQMRNSKVGINQKMGAVYNYLCSHEFKQRIESIVEAFINMQDDLNKEKAATYRMWAKREKLINNIIKSTSGMYGDIHALAGSVLPVVERLELPVVDEIEVDNLRSN